MAAVKPTSHHRTPSLLSAGRARDTLRPTLSRRGPPGPETAAKAAVAEAQLKKLYDELVLVQKDLGAVEAQIAEAENIPALLTEVRRKHSERVRAERAVRKEERARNKEDRQAETARWRRRTLPYLGAGVSSGLVYEGGDASKTAAMGLPALVSASDLALAIGIDERELAFLTYHRQRRGRTVIRGF